MATTNRTVCFDVVVPSIPGFGFSDAPVASGFNPIAACHIFQELMLRLGYSKFVIHGSDWGSLVGGLLARLYPGNVIGFHSTFVIPPVETLSDKLKLLKAYIFSSHAKDAAKLSKIKLSELFLQTLYFHGQGTTPDTLGVGFKPTPRISGPVWCRIISENPIGLAAWIVEKFENYVKEAEFVKAKYSGKGEGITNEDILTNIMIYWLTEHSISAANFYKYFF